MPDDVFTDSHSFSNVLISVSPFTARYSQLCLSVLFVSTENNYENAFSKKCCHVTVGKAQVKIIKIMLAEFNLRAPLTGLVTPVCFLQ